MEHEKWQPSSEDFTSAIQKASKCRRSNCWSFLEEFVEMYAAECSRQELDRVWVDLVKEYPWYAEDLLHCLREVLANKRRPLSELVADVAELELEALGLTADNSDVVHDRQKSARRWLQQLYEQFDAVFEELSDPPPRRTQQGDQ